MNEQEFNNELYPTGDALFNKLLSVNPENIGLLYSVIINLDNILGDSEYGSSVVAVTKDTQWGNYVVLHTKEVESMGYNVSLVSKGHIGDGFNLNVDVVGLVTKA